MDYVTFLLDLAADGENRAIRETVRYRRDLSQRPKNAFEWKVTVDSRCKVIVVGLVGEKPRIIASASWHAGTLAEHKHREPNTPSSFQWNLVEVALREELARRAGMHDRSGEPPVADEDLIEDRATLERELDPPPPDALVPYDPVREIDRDRAARKAHKRSERQRERSRKVFVGIWIAVIAGAAILVPVVVCGKRQTPSSNTAPAAAPPRAPLPPPPPVPMPPDAAPEPLEVRIVKAATFTEAVALAKPAMTDTTDELGGGAKLFATYAVAKLRWADVDVAAETTVAHVLKDPDVERGKRMCVDGVIASIERRDLERRKVFVGSLRLADGDAVTFVAVGTTGELVKRNPARFCGAVIGKAGSAASMVGMFDLPENRTPIVEQ